MHALGPGFGNGAVEGGRFLFDSLTSWVVYFLHDTYDDDDFCMGNFGISLGWLDCGYFWVGCFRGGRACNDDVGMLGTNLFITLLIKNELNEVER